MNYFQYISNLLNDNLRIDESESVVILINYEFPCYDSFLIPRF